MNTVILLNVIVLLCLLVFLVREEIRFRHFSKRVADTKEDLTLIVHQLRSPLSNLRKYNGFLQSDEFGALSIAQQEAISKVQASLGDSLMILDRLLARMRLDEQDVTTQPTLLNAEEMVQGAVDALMPLAHKKKHTVTIDGNRRAQVFGDPLLLHGILDEILSNALHYTPEGGTITVTIADVDKFVLVAVKDTGIGISAAEKLHIFEKFYRGERTKSMFAGSGLGLSFAKKFTEKMGGKVTFQSKEENGSTFTLALPKKPKRTAVV